MGGSGSGRKSFDIPKRLVWEAYRQVKANGGAPGVDGQSIDEFAQDLQNNLYRIWNRMSSGSYFPPPVRAVEIPKADGGTRMLGVPTVADRVAQTVVALALQPRTEAIFHPDSYGYRPGRSQHDALAACRRRCRSRDWVIDLDIRKFFDSVDHDLMVKAVQANINTGQAWVLLYVRRWLTAPLQLPDGTLVARDRGTPQGSAVSPVLANLFMHYAFDRWLEREFPTVEFERYADDAVVHCVTERQAREVLAALDTRMAEVGLALHPDKTKIVYCKDDDRRGEYPVTSFTFLAYTFRARTLKSKTGNLFDRFAPAISPVVLKNKGRELREMRIHRRTGLSLDDLAAMINPVVAGWMDYYGRHCRWKLYPLLGRVNSSRPGWARNKNTRLRAFGRLAAWWHGIFDRDPELFAHWRWVGPYAGG